MRNGILAIVFGWLACSSAMAEFQVSAFDIPSIDGGRVAFEPGTGQEGQPQWTVLCFLGTECPLAKLYVARLSQFATQFESRGVRFIGISSNQHDSVEELQLFAEKFAVSFPVGKDFDNLIADACRAERTPEVIVLDAAGTVRYRGRVDDQYAPGLARAEVQRNDLRIALEELLAGNSVSVAKTPVTGCLIGRVRKSDATDASVADPNIADSSVTFCNQVTRVLQRNCVECHRDGEIGPFALTDYDETIGWADMILEVIDNGRMPPWHADPQHGDFLNARVMTDADKQILHDWVALGTPYGDESDLPEPVEFVDGWRLDREPDLVLSMSEQPFAVPADGTVEYQYFVVDPQFEEDRWITGAQVKPGDRGVVHHSIVFVRPPDGARFRGVGWLSAYVPGNRGGAFPGGYAIRIPKGSKIVFQQHYTPTGIETHDITQIGLTFGEPEKITHEIYTIVGIDQEFEIPPHAANYEVTARVRRLPERAELLGVMPHMHLRGKSFRLWGERDQQRQILLDVPRYDFNWQHLYEFSDRLKLGDFDRLDFTVSFDNSAGNPVNPDPSQHVHWGDQTWEEMAVAFFEVAEPRAASQASGVQTETPLTSEQQARIRQIVDQFFQFDKNQDGVVDRLELPLASRRFVSQWAQDGERLTREDIERQAEQRVR